jgi:UDP-galactopyranose mutase
MKFLVVGAGMSGAVIARELAEAGHKVDVIDKRGHVGGNCFDYVNIFGIRVHKYGPHIFHTSNEKVVEWHSQFTEWIEYKHKVKAILSDGRYVTLPVNRETN